MKIIEHKIIETDNYTEELVPRRSELITLINDESLKKNYIESLDINYYNSKNLEKLRKKHKAAFNRNVRNNNSSLKKLMDELFGESILTKYESDVLLAKSRISNFEKNLAYLICLDVISLEDAKERGFDSTYIAKLLEDYKVSVNSEYEHYYTYENHKQK